MSAVRLRSTETGEQQTIPVDGVFEFVALTRRARWWPICAIWTNVGS